MFVFVLLLVAFAAASKSEIKSNFYYEESCKGGYCVLKNECHYKVSSEDKNLCPNQKSEGAVCCKGFPIEKVNCFQTHNSCMKTENCPQFLQRGRKGCKETEVCCTLVV